MHAFDPTLYIQAQDPTATARTPVPSGYLGPGTFLIGNHADELTPWIPLIATLERASGYLSIPCCAWSFDARFVRASAVDARMDLASDDEEAFLARLNLEGEGGHQSRYAVYRIWLARLSAWMGWRVECDTLRIPSTRNWAIVGAFTSTCVLGAVPMRDETGRERLGDDTHVYIRRALDIVEGVVKRGAFKTRVPEGKAGGH